MARSLKLDLGLVKDFEEYGLEIPGYPKGSDITIINCNYIGRRKDEYTGEIQKDYLFILFRDNVTGEKKVHIIEEPLYTFYKLKDDLPPLTHNLFFIEKDKVEPVTCRYRDVVRTIANITGNDDKYYENIALGNSKENNKFHSIPDIFRSQINVEDYYRFLFGQNYKNTIFKLKKAFMDIEVDGKNSLSDFPEMGECPINAIAFLDENSNTVYQLLLENYNNPLINMYKNSSSTKKGKEKLRNFVINAVGGYKKAHKYKVDTLDYKIIFFDEETELIKGFFKLLEQTSPDMLLIWNMAFDLNYITARAENLGMDVLQLVCDSRLQHKFFRFYVDEKNKNDYAERGDYVSVAGFTVWLDQMIQFASRRKGRGRYNSYKLDDIGNDVAHVKKLDYSHITTDINMLPYLDFETFSFYNIMDVIVQKCIEASTQDCEYIFTKCIVNNTRYSKGHRQSAYLSNRFSKDFDAAGYILGNNRNLWNEKPNTKFPGAMVGDPTHNSIYALVWINGRPTLLANNVIDFDYSSLYPSIILENNIAPNTQFGMIRINRKVHKWEHPDMYTSDDTEAKYSRGGEFLENYMSGNVLEFCRRWFHLGDIYDVIGDIAEFFKYNDYTDKGLDWNRNEALYDKSDKLIPALEKTSYNGYPALIPLDDISNEEKQKLIEKIKGDCLI